MSNRSLRAALAAASLGGLVLGCENLARTNPWDPQVPVSLTISGPDVAVMEDTVKYTVRAEPDVPGAVPVWISSTPQTFIPFGDGRFRVQGIAPYNATVIVIVGADTASKTIAIVAKPRSP